MNLIEFKLWLELHQTLKELQNISDSPDTFFNVPDFITFIFDPGTESLYQDKSTVSHNMLMQMNYIKYEWRDYLFGRYGQINEDNRNHFEYVSSFSFSELPINIITFYKNWGGKTVEVTPEICDSCLKCLLNQNIIDYTYIVLDGTREPHYINEKAKNNEIKHYQIGTFKFTSDNIRDWMGKLHYLPPTSPERSSILHYAELISKSEYAQELSNFLSRVNFKMPMKRNKYQQELQNQGLGGYNDLWRGKSESFKI